MMKLTFLGGADEVGASSTLVEIGGKTILVDAGIRISPRTSKGIQNSQLPDLQPISAIGGPDIILVTHAHTDHTGALPLILEQYPHVPVFATQPTVDLVRVLQSDAQRIMRSKQEEEGELPLFDEISVQRLMDAFQIVSFGQSIKLGDHLQATYQVSGHIVGAAMLILESADGTLILSGDLSLTEQRAVVKAQIPHIQADALVLESTYGGRLHANRIAEERRLIEKLKEVTERGGKVLIPAFALGRAQEIIQIILAYRDELNVPVYVDGMVRAVCAAYSGWADLLPTITTKMAGDKPLFFRERIASVKNLAHRHDIMHSSEPLVIIASSGMLTGGASAAYALALADDERNAILLTGYQDEEAPGKFLQRLMSQRQTGETPLLRIGDATVKVRCQLDTYSLSAHADEAELMSIVDALNPDEVLLVHGDPAARHSLATKLRQRERMVITPKIGQTRIIEGKKRPWAIAKITSGHETGPVNIARLWESLADRAGDFYSARELALMWWGTAERQEEMARALANDTIYFAADWRAKQNFRVRTPEQVSQALQSRQIMLRYPNLVGQLVALRNSNGQPRLGVVREGGEDSFKADVAGTKGTQYAGNALLWPLGAWQGYGEGSTRAQLSALTKEAIALKDTLLPYETRQKLAAQGQPIRPEECLPPKLPDGISLQLALAAIVLALATDGATLEEDGLLPRRAVISAVLDQNSVREIALAAFPPEARLRKVGLEPSRRRLVLSFDFPDIIPRRYGHLLEDIAERSGWETLVKPTVNQQALFSEIDAVLPDDVRILKGPSFFAGDHAVAITTSEITPEAAEAASHAYLERTGFRLIINRQGAPAGGEITPTTETQMEINAAYALIRNRLEAHGLYKTSLKSGRIVLSFISPQVGERHLSEIQALSQETGYNIEIHPHPNQQQILAITTKLAREAGWTIVKGPGIRVEQAEITLKIAEKVDEAQIAAIAERVWGETGYQLLVTSS